MLNSPGLVALVLSERRVLPPDLRAAWDRTHRLHMEEWARALRLARPGLGEGEVALLVNAAAGMLLTTVRYRSGLDRSHMENILQEMAATALLGAPPGSEVRVGAAPTR